MRDNITQVNMDEQLEDCIEMFGADVSTLVTSLATKKVSEVREDVNQMSDNKG